MSDQTNLQSSNRVGFHYFQDQNHFREKDLAVWLPELKSLGASWLVLQANLNCAIPEYFLSSLLENQIQPILFAPMLNQQPPSLEEVKPIFTAYSHWGARYIILADRPNDRSMWPSSAWAQEELVERFLDHYLPLANLALQEGLKPILPPLTPGGNYWDTAFLRSLLESLTRRRQTMVLDQLILSAYCWTHQQHLNWGAGGPERWPAVKPYQTRDEEDHRGFRIFDWYQAIAQAATGQETPIILLQAGASGVTAASHPATDPAVVSQAILQNLFNHPVNDPHLEDLTLEPIPQSVKACNFWLLSEDANGLNQAYAWYPAVGNPSPIVGLCQEMAAKSSAETVAAEKALPELLKAEFYQKDEQPARQRPIRHYLLLPLQEWGVADWHLEVVKPYIRKHRPTVGFSLKEAVLAEKVTVIGNEESFPEKVLNHLRSAGCFVERIQGDGTTIATLLAER
jgi:hypothetical protein